MVDQTMKAGSCWVCTNHRKDNTYIGKTIFSAYLEERTWRVADFFRWHRGHFGSGHFHQGVSRRAESPADYSLGNADDSTRLAVGVQPKQTGLCVPTRSRQRTTAVREDSGCPGDLLVRWKWECWGEAAPVPCVRHGDQPILQSVQSPNTENGGVQAEANLQKPRHRDVRQDKGGLLLRTRPTVAGVQSSVAQTAVSDSHPPLKLPQFADTGSEGPLSTGGLGRPPRLSFEHLHSAITI